VSQIKIGALLNYTTIFLTNVIGILLTPFILNHLGTAEYGIYLTIGALVGTISLLDFGLNNTIVRFVAKYKAQKDTIGQENFLATAFILYGIISSLIVIIGVIFYGYLEAYFTQMDAQEIEIAKVIFIIFIFNLATGLPGGALTGICYGYERFVFSKSLNIIRYILRSIVVVAILSMGGKAIALVIIDSIFNILIIIITGYYVFKTLEIKIKLHNFSVRFIKEIFGYSTWIFVFALVSLFQWQAGHWVLGHISPPEVLSIYGIGIVLGTYYGAFSTAISSLFLPRATQMSVANATGEELTSMMIKIGRISFIVLMYILIAFVLFGKQFVFLWVGKELGEIGSFQSWMIAVLIMVAYTLPLVQGFGNSILEAKSKLAFKAILYLSFMILGTALGAYLATKHGAIGMIIGSITAWIIVQNVMNFYYHHRIGLNILRFFKELLHKTFFALLIIIAIGYVIRFIPGDGWINFVIKAICYTLVFTFTIYHLGCIAFEKELFKKSFGLLWNKIKL